MSSVIISTVMTVIAPMERICIYSNSPDQDYVSLDDVTTLNVVQCTDNSSLYSTVGFNPDHLNIAWSISSSTESGLVYTFASKMIQ